MSEANPLGLCPSCLEKLRPVLRQVVANLRLADEGLSKLKEAAKA